MFKIFGHKEEKKSRPIMELDVSEPLDCLADFTFNFYWQHKGQKLDPTWIIPGTDITFGQVVEHLKYGGDVCIKGDAGHRLASSMGVDLQYFGGSGHDIPVGDIYVDGNVDTRMGISMSRGCIYVKGEVKEPIGNVLQVKSNKKGYRKFRSITDIATNGLDGDKLLDSELSGNKLIIDDGKMRDTVGARLNKKFTIILEGNADLSTGILMRDGVVRINGNAGKNTGALLNGGIIIIDGSTDDFTAIDMIKGKIIVNGDAGKFMGANKKSGMILSQKGKPIPPCKEVPLGPPERDFLISSGFNPQNFKKFQ